MAAQSRTKQVIGGVFWGLFGLGFGVWMLVQPKVEWLEDEGPTRARSKALYEVLQFVWGMPGGTC